MPPPPPPPKRHRCRCGAEYVGRPHCPPLVSRNGHVYPSTYARVVRDIACDDCGAIFVWHGRGTPRYCKDCRRDREREHHRADNRRRRHSARVYTESFSRRRVFERDGWRCQLCGRAIGRSAKAPQPLSATLDHIVPIAAGGPHTYANVQAAHFICNVRRGVGGIAQLRLPI